MAKNHNYNKLILISDFENEMILYKEFQSKWVKIFMPEPNDYNPSGHNPIFVQNSKRDLFLCQRKNIYKLVDDKWILDLDLNNTLLNCELNCFSIVDDTYWIGTNLGLFRIIKTYNKN